MPAEIPAIPWIDRAVEIATRDEAALDMEHWHSMDGVCGTTHCRAGHVTHLANTVYGDDILDLELRLGTSALAAMIYARSGRPVVPDFHAGNTAARDDIKRCAEESERA